MKKINLLPHWVQKSKAKRRLVILLAAVQAAIFLVLCIVVISLSVWESRIFDYSRELDEKLGFFDPVSAQVSAELQAARANAAYIKEFLALPEIFTWDFLTIIPDTIPIGVSLTRLEYKNGEMLFISSVTDIITIETHRAVLAGIFPNVRIGRISSLEGGSYSYELFVRLGDEE